MFQVEIIYDSKDPQKIRVRSCYHIQRALMINWKITKSKKAEKLFHFLTSFALFQQSVTVKVIIGLKNATLGKVTRSRIKILVLFNICLPEHRGKDMKGFGNIISLCDKKV